MSKSEKRIRDQVVPVRFSEEERAMLIDAAEAEGLSVGAFIRKKTIGDPGERFQKRPPADRAELVRILAQLGKIGSNVNQLARRTNAGEKLAGPTLEKALEAIRETLAAVRKAVVR